MPATATALSEIAVPPGGASSWMPVSKASA
jgi:hypothetical protein